ncbi:hypothetical protein FRC06_000133 [Ceratobasidium sp. 370]|nr:hypothetical protein FRC06_000133 [Ceratobasidium sp. 370]
MMRQFLPVVIDVQAPPDFIQMIRALLDFAYLAHSARLTDVELAEMDDALAAFHKAKGVLVRQKMVAGEGSFDQIAKLHMVSHYANDTRELRTLDGYSTETPEYLHIVYAKIPWRMSNRRNPFPQMVKFVRRLEAIHIQQTFIDECYGEREGADEEEIQQAEMFLKDEAGAEGGEAEGIDEESVDSEDEEDVVEVRLENSAVSDQLTHYPHPAITIAQQPTAWQVPGHVLASSYEASDFLRALCRFILIKTSQQPLILPSDRFDVWHKATLNHLPLPFAPSEPCHRNVVCAHPVVRDRAGCIKDAGIFDTALFTTDLDRFGLTRFHAGRVHAIFTLPPDLRHLYSRPLVFLDVYTPFMPDTSSLHRLYQAHPARLEAGYVSLVIPLSCIVMACHLAPHFSVPRVSRPYFFNDFYNHFTFLLMAYWH